MDFGALPPEVNSGSMYAGAGPGPLLAAAAAWNGIASELGAAALAFGAVVTRLTTEQWVSPASLSMAAAVQPLLDWFAQTAESSAHAASQAMASAAAFERAFASIVPPAQITANRAQLARLIATNTLGQNVPAIAAAEARYGEMWAQDAAVMYEYAAASAVAGRLNLLAGPAPVTNPAGAANQAAATGAAAQESLSALVTHGPAAVQSLAAPAAPEAGGLMGLLRDFDSADLGWWELFHHNRATYSDYTMGALSNLAPAAEEDEAEEIAAEAAPPAATAAAAARPAAAQIVATPVSAALGKASFAGSLAVPATWSGAVPAPVTKPALDGTYWAVPEAENDQGAVPAPGMIAESGDVGALPVPRYGVKPTVMPKRGII
ncbi:PPE family protein [Mycobacterium asiaticum]|uniref:PPE family domain-containing protein n=1 Tax=Mycobacterium asiaticum TaxID=1790 RepID=A0A1A3BNU4_MYCAS|nr:PPE family protein [Mycobacterium asiaticum]OBI75597.1 hypothetical protein A9X01_04625 [Mycobacterium asiaticum]